MPSPSDWSRAFAQQARADLNTYRVCCITPAVPIFHRYQFLQMACEKVAKSHLCAAGTDPQRVQSSHAYTAKVVPIVIRDQLALLGPTHARRFGWVGKGVRPLVREIELLSPSVDDGGNRPANCEYPWVDAVDRLHVPADDLFPNLAALDSHLGVVFLKLFRAAVNRLAL